MFAVFFSEYFLYGYFEAVSICSLTSLAVFEKDSRSSSARRAAEYRLYDESQRRVCSVAYPSRAVFSLLCDHTCLVNS